MKILIFTTLLSLFGGCVSQSATTFDYASAKPTPDQIEPIQNVKSVSAEKNARFETASEEWRKTDFKNFNYPSAWNKNGITLDDGSYTFDSKNHRGFINFDRVFYLDLTDDDKKEAVVLLTEFLCETSCDGGSQEFYIFKMNRDKPEIIWKYSGGSRGYDGGLKSFVVKDKEITAEKFQKCSFPDPKDFQKCWSKYQAKNIVRQIFAFDGKRIVEKSNEIINTDVVNVFNHSSEISVNE